MRLATALAATIAAALAVPVAASAADYSYRTIAKGSEFGRCAAINNFGAVAFVASEFDEETGNSEDSVRRGSGGPPTTIAAESDGFTSISGNPSINDLGAVAFDGNPVGPDRELIARGSGGPLTEIARAGSAQPFDSFTADVSLNVFGRVAFTGELNDDLGDEGLFEGSGGPVATRYLASTSVFAGSIASPSLSELELVSFTEETDGGVRGVFRQGPGGNVTTIADDTGELQSFGSDTSLNNLGRVAFTAFDEGFTQYVFTGRGGPLTEVANTGGEYAFFGGRGPSTNDLGRVAFEAELDDFGSGVFTGPDPVADAVIRTGDVVDGETVQSVSGCREMLNARGQVAVRVTFEDFSQAIVRATPRR